jgi:hypothetical protein
MQPVSLSELQAIVDRPHSFYCGMKDDVLDLVPESAQAFARDTTLGLAANPRCWIQTSSDVPSVLRDRLIVGDDLWLHLPDDVRFQRLSTFEITAPVLWIEHRFSGALEPLMLDCPEWREICQVVEQRRDPATLSPQTREALLLSGALLAEPSAYTNGRAARLSDLARELATNRFVVLPDVIDPLQLAALRRHFRTLRAQGLFQVDKRQVVGMRDGLYCELSCMFFQRQLAPLVSVLAQEQIKPSYTWVRRYLPGAQLRRHVDRPQCKWNISLCIDNDPDLDRQGAWPLFLEVSGQVKQAKLGMGDAVLYPGAELPHWREALQEKHSVTMCFFHYVAKDFSGSLA